MKNKTLLNGFYAGSIFLIWKLGVLMLGKQHEWLPTFPAGPLLLLMSVFIFISITRFTGPESSFVDDFKAGARTGLVAAIVAGLGVFVYYSWFDPEFMPTRIQINIDAMKAMNDPNVKPEDITKAEEQMTEFFAPFSWTTLTVSGSAFFGMAFSLILSGLKRAFRSL